MAPLVQAGLILKVLVRAAQLTISLAIFSEIFLEALGPEADEDVEVADVREMIFKPRSTSLLKRLLLALKKSFESLRIFVVNLALEVEPLPEALLKPAPNVRAVEKWFFNKGFSH